MADDTTTEPVSTDTTTSEPVATETPAAHDDLGDGGKKALDTERAARRASDKAARDAQKRADDLEARLAEFEDANKSETEKAIETARKEADAAARAEVTSSYEHRILEADIRAAAAGKIADPADAIRLIDVSSLERDASGQVEQKTIDAAIADLVKTKPYLVGAATAGPGSADGGTRSTNGVTLAQLKNMTPQQVAALDPKIVEAAMSAGH